MGRLGLSVVMCVLLVSVGSPCLADYQAEVTADNPSSWWRFEDASSSKSN